MYHIRLHRRVPLAGADSAGASPKMIVDGHRAAAGTGAAKRRSCGRATKLAGQVQAGACASFVRGDQVKQHASTGRYEPRASSEHVVMKRAAGLGAHQFVV